MYFDPAETMDRSSLEDLQAERLRNTVINARMAPFYLERLAGFDAADITSPADITKLPFTTKDDLRSHCLLYTSPSPRD